MGFERSKFGDGSTAGNGNVVRTVSNHYGQRDTGKTAGVIKTEGGMNELTIDLDGEMLAAEAFPLLAPEFRAFSRIEDAYIEVEEAFDLDGTTPSIDVGTEGSEATNGVNVTATQLEAQGVYDVTSALKGTWAGATGFTANTTVGIALEGDASVADTTVGRARLVIRYVKV